MTKMGSFAKPQPSDTAEISSSLMHTAEMHVEDQESLQHESNEKANQKDAATDMMLWTNNKSFIKVFETPNESPFRSV